MKITQRPYERGDEVDINKLYKLISGRDRTIDQYRWEWIDTWDGQGSIWLAFDDECQDGDKIIMQYSLIPTPMSVWGKSYLSGKTENCMCHPAYRGKGQYFKHEKGAFEEAKSKFSLFFTTAGNKTKGAAGAVRRKLGYTALDSWTRYIFCLKSRYVQDLFHTKYDKRVMKYQYKIIKAMVDIIAHIFPLYFKLRHLKLTAADVKILDRQKVNLCEIENLWERNKKHYAITIDRKSVYLAWRVNNNPYFDYKYLLYYKEKQLVGYAIFAVNKQNVLLILDMIAEDKNLTIFKTLVNHLIWNAKKVGANAITCNTLIGNPTLNEVFTQCGFLNTYKVLKHLLRKKTQDAFHVYVSPKVECAGTPLKPENWYVTDLFREF